MSAPAAVAVAVVFAVVVVSTVEYCTRRLERRRDEWARRDREIVRELRDRHNGNRHDTPRTAIQRVSWRSQQALSSAQREATRNDTATGPTCHGAHRGVAQ